MVRDSYVWVAQSGVSPRASSLACAPMVTWQWMVGWISPFVRFGIPQAGYLSARLAPDGRLGWLDARLPATS
jgi:hypothetical protein